MDMFVEAIAGVHVRGPIVRVETTVGRVRQSADGKTDTLMVPNGDLVLTIDSALRLHEALSALVQQLKKQGVIQPRKESDSKLSLNP